MVEVALDAPAHAGGQHRRPVGSQQGDLEFLPLSDVPTIVADWPGASVNE